ncbi:MAG: NUDIX hydrolase [candidate division TM6 bacterium GW2011_GWF2_37_49]|nr:MAG: NUDIX hydrolase [candidate division TM6 bacterium GW2011_GWF2_37_49]
MKDFRLSAAGVILHQEKVLLVRYKGQNGGTFLVGPGGGVQIEEDLHAGLKREVLEETGLHVNPGKMLVVEDLLASKYRVIKVWFLCSVVGGELAKTEEARIEGIIDVGWYDKKQLANKTVYPEILQNFDWAEFSSNNFETKYLTMKKANF